MDILFPVAASITRADKSMLALAASLPSGLNATPIFANTIYDPTTERLAANGGAVRDPFPNNIIPDMMISPVDAPVPDPILNPAAWTPHKACLERMPFWSECPLWRLPGAAAAAGKSEHRPQFPD